LHNGSVPRSSRNPGAIGRARFELMRDPARSNRLIARAARCDSCTVQRARKGLEAAGTIPLTSGVRVVRPNGRRPPLARNAIALLGTSATPRQVADLAHISIQAAWRALRDVRAGQPPPHLARGLCATVPEPQRGWWASPDTAEQDAARRLCLSACDALNECIAWSLTRPEHPNRVYGGFTPPQLARLRRAARTSRPVLADLAAATDSMLISRQPARICLVCGAEFTPARPPSAGGVPQVYCSAGCSRLADIERKRSARLRRDEADTAARIPRIRELNRPPAPNWSEGVCAWHPNAELWTSDSPSERELARALCHTCPIEQPCRDWSAHLPMSDDAIYGGLTRAERRTLRRAHLAQIAREALAGS
jgi:hypothetical protein